MAKFKLQIQTPLTKSWSTIFTGNKTAASAWFGRMTTNLGSIHAMRVIREDDGETTTLMNMRRTCQSCDYLIHGVDSCRCELDQSLGHDVHNIIPDPDGFNTGDTNDCKKYR